MTLAILSAVRRKMMTDQLKISASIDVARESVDKALGYLQDNDLLSAIREVRWSKACLRCASWRLSKAMEDED
jgi:hypothetical protein